MYGPLPFEVEAGGELKALPPLPDLLDHDGDLVPREVLGNATRTLSEAESHFETVRGVGGDYTLNPIELAGYYDLGASRIPVFAHQQAGFEALIEQAATPSVRAMSFFGDIVPPFPSPRSLREFVDYVRHEGEPEFIKAEMRADPGEVARKIIDEDPTMSRMYEIIDGYWETTLARSKWSLPAFRELVRQRENELRHGGFTPEYGRGEKASPDEAKPQPIVELDLLPRSPQRSLEAPFKAVLKFAKAELPADRQQWNDCKIDVDWSSTFSNQHLGYWTYVPSGKGRGKRLIRLNRVYQTSKEAVSDEMLEFLLWHEFLHDVLPGRGHDAEFRELEMMWPDAVGLNANWDTLNERWDLDAAKYRPGGK